MNVVRLVPKSISPKVTTSKVVDIFSKRKTSKIVKLIPKAIPKTSPLKAILGKFLGGIIGAVIGELLNPKSVAKTDLESVEKFLGYKAEPAKTAQPEIPEDWFGGQDPTKTYKLSYSRASTYRGTFYGWLDGYTSTVSGGIIAPVSAPELRIASLKLETFKHWSSNNQGIPPLYNSETRGYEVYVTMGNGQRVRVLSGSMSGCWMKGFIPQDSDTPDGTNPPPKQEAIIENNSAVLAIPPQPVSTDNPTLPAIPKTFQPTSTKERKAGYPIGNPVIPPSSLPKTLNRPQLTPDIQDPTSAPFIPVSPALGTIPGRSGNLPLSNPVSVSKPTSLASNPTSTIRRKIPTLSSGSAIDTSNPAIPTFQKTVAPVTSLPVPLPAPGVNVTSSNLDWNSVLAPIVLSSYTSNQFRDEVKTQTGDAICQSTKPGGCMQTDILNPLKNKLGDLAQGLGLIGEGANLYLNDSILNRVNDIQSKVNNSTFGLQAISDFMKNAWQNTKLDKVLNVLNTVLALHNALMLSRNLAQTLGDVTSQALSFLGIKDAEGQAIDINSFIGNTVETWITNLVGAQTYANIQ